MYVPVKITMTLKNITLAAALVGLIASPMLAFAQTATGTPAVVNQKRIENQQKQDAKRAEMEKKQAEKKAAADKLKANRAAANAQALTCVQTAMDKREDAIIAAWNAYSPTITAALTARKTALHESWTKLDSKSRATARNAAWEAYRTSVKTAATTLKNTRKTAWEGFEKDSKACKMPVADERGRSDNI